MNFLQQTNLKSEGKNVVDSTVKLDESDESFTNQPTQSFNNLTVNVMSDWDL